MNLTRADLVVIITLLGRNREPPAPALFEIPAESIEQAYQAALADLAGWQEKGQAQ